MRLRKQKRHVDGLFMSHAGVACMIGCQVEGKLLQTRIARPLHIWVGGARSNMTATWRGGRSPGDFYFGISPSGEGRMRGGARIVTSFCYRDWFTGNTQPRSF